MTTETERRVESSGHEFVVPHSKDRSQRVVLCAPGHHLGEALEVALTTFGSLDGVRVVAYGATLDAGALLDRYPRLQLAELGAYARRPILSSVESVQDALDEWLNKLFAGTVDGAEPARVFRASAEARLIGFGPLTEMPVVLGFIEEHRTADVLLVGGGWWATGLLQGSLQQLRVFGRPSERSLWRRQWRVSFAFAQLAGILMSCVTTLRDHVGGQAAREEASRRAPAGAPDMWIGVSSDRKKLNLHILQVAATVRGVRLGMLVFPPFAPVERVGPKLRLVKRRSPWPALRGDAFADTLPLELLDAWPRTGQLTAGLLGFARSALVVGARVLAGSSKIRLGQGYVIDVSALSGRLARLCTIDLLRARQSAATARRILEKYDLSGRFVVLAKSNLPDAAALHLGLQQGGAITVDYFHGWMAEAVPIACDSPANVRCVWANTDRDPRASQGLRNAVYALGGTLHRRRREPGEREARILILSNYSHRDIPLPKREYQRLLQREILKTGELLRVQLPRVDVRWRPHPADLEELIAPEASQAHARGIGVSVEHSLADDLEWADVCVSSCSTAAIEAMLAGLPVFVHVQAEFWSRMAWVDDRRRFFRAERGFLLISEYLALEPSARTCDEERRSVQILLGNAPARDLLEALQRAS